MTAERVSPRPRPCCRQPSPLQLAPPGPPRAPAETPGPPCSLPDTSEAKGSPPPLLPTCHQLPACSLSAITPPGQMHKGAGRPFLSSARLSHSAFFRACETTALPPFAVLSAWHLVFVTSSHALPTLSSGLFDIVTYAQAAS